MQSLVKICSVTYFVETLQNQRPESAGALLGETKRDTKWYMAVL